VEVEANPEQSAEKAQVAGVDGVKTWEDPEMFDEVQRAILFTELHNRVTT
jgi:hypothetical protein